MLIYQQQLEKKSIQIYKEQNGKKGFAVLQIIKKVISVNQYFEVVLQTFQLMQEVFFVYKTFCKNTNCHF